MKSLDAITAAAKLLSEDLVHAESGSDLERKVIIAHLIKFREECSRNTATPEVDEGIRLTRANVKGYEKGFKAAAEEIANALGAAEMLNGPVADAIRLIERMVAIPSSNTATPAPHVPAVGSKNVIAQALVNAFGEASQGEVDQVYDEIAWLLAAEPPKGEI
jgi:hypothetical protein